ncbi:MAG: hypothetical protein NDI73_13020 [Desulfuromonadales bacterium]|nr:hypothetical protein [Desulfuromonadales bacterium]
MPHKAEVRTTLLPGQKGTVRLYKEYGDQLICVRYRYDKLRGRRLKTVELVVDEQPWVPGVTIPAERQVAVRIGYNEQDLRERVKQAGGYWDADRKAWRLGFGKVLQLGLERRLLDEELGF